MKHDITVDLDAMIDAHGLAYVLVSLSLVCSERASMMRIEGRDRETIKSWDKAGNELEETARKLAELPI